MVRSAVSNHPGNQNRLQRSDPMMAGDNPNLGTLKAPPPGGPNGPALTAPPTR
jgi:hypothetical protein